jgi:hypothetical protein
MAITPAFWMPVIYAANRDDVDAALQTTEVKSWALNAPAEFYAHHGARHPMGDDFAGMQDHVAFTMDEQTIRETSSRVPLSVVKGVMLTGTLTTCSSRRDHGVRYILDSPPCCRSRRWSAASSGYDNRRVSTCDTLHQREACLKSTLVAQLRA